MNTISDINFDAVETRLKALRDNIADIAADWRDRAHIWDMGRTRRRPVSRNPAVLLAAAAGIGVVAGLAFLVATRPGLYGRARRRF